MRRFFISLFCLAFVAACASSPPASTSGPESASTAKKPPRRPVRSRLTPPGQAELEAAIKAARKNDLDAAIAECRAAIQKNPQLEQAYLLLGSACAMKEDAACEQAAYAQGLEALPRSAALTKEQALVRLQAGQVDDAVAGYEAALKLVGGQDAEYMGDLAYAYVYAARLDDAVQMAQGALKLDPKCFPCAMALGQANLSKKDFDAAVQAYGQAEALQTEGLDATHGLAKAYFLAGRLDEAAQAYDRLIGQAPDDMRLRVQASQVAMKRKRFKQAVTHLSAVAAAHPDNRDVLERLLAAQTKAKDGKGAKKTRQRIRALKGSSP